MYIDRGESGLVEESLGHLHGTDRIPDHLMNGLTKYWRAHWCNIQSSCTLSQLFSEMRT